MLTKDLSQAKETLLKNELIALPTETVYGLAGNAYSEEAIKKIFALKNRPLHNPLIVHIKSIDYLENVAKDIPEMAYELAKTFWPGPLTLVLKKKEHIPDLVTAGNETVAIRMPNHPVALALLENLEFPLAAPSANPFGSISPTSAAHVLNYFGDTLKVILDGGECARGIESTIIGFENNEPILYRLGSISLEEIEERAGKVRRKTNNEEKPEAPGMLSRHYAPATTMILTDDLTNEIKVQKGKKIGLLLFNTPVPNDHVFCQEILSKSGDFKEAAKNLYAAMHRLDQGGLELILAERLPNIGLGKTINDKLARASKK